MPGSLRVPVAGSRKSLKQVSGVQLEAVTHMQAVLKLEPFQLRHVFCCCGCQDTIQTRCCIDDVAYLRPVNKQLG
jgi:hypothetical protein